MALQNNFFNLDGKTYKQTDGVAIGSTLGSSSANTFFMNKYGSMIALKILSLYISFSGYILILIVSFMTNIKLVLFLLCYFEHFSLTF